MPSSTFIADVNLRLRSLSDIDRSTMANDPRPSASFSARKNPQCIPATTPPVFLGLWPRIWPHLVRLVTNAMSDRLLVRHLLVIQPDMVSEFMDHRVADLVNDFRLRPA